MIVAGILVGLAAVAGLVAFELLVQAIDVQAESDGAPDSPSGTAGAGPQHF
ncbi:hypothetical protein [Leifsonia poae]|uniref:hypothetical protein n=1 Tax=Leifsonia poae TaxID=110933 RepID=UPI001CBFD422|nr:hypothetical protein [Leifsonia poae]